MAKVTIIIEDYIRDDGKEGVRAYAESDNKNYEETFPSEQVAADIMNALRNDAKMLEESGFAALPESTDPDPTLN